MYLDTRELSSRDAYKLLIGSVVPRPIGWVSTVSAADVGNLAPFSFFMAATGNPPTVVLSTSFRDGEPKDTLRNVMEVPEFVLNVVSEDGQLHDSFHYGAALTGLAAARVGEQAVLLVATDEGVTAWRVE